MAKLIDESGVTRFEGEIENGGSQPGGLCSAERLFTEQATPAGLPITAVNDVAGTVTVAGDHVAAFPIGSDSFGFTIFGSTGNDNTYSALVSATLVGGNTVIDTGNPLSDATADGSVYPPEAYTASVDIASGSLIADIRVYMLALWNSTLNGALLAVGDNFAADSYFAEVSLLGGNPYDPQNPTMPDSGGPAIALSTGNGFQSGTLSGSGYQRGGGANVTTGDFAWEVFRTIGGHANSLRTIPGVGVRYAADDTITMLARAQINSFDGPIVAPVGISLVKVFYYAPVTAVDAVRS